MREASRISSRAPSGGNAKASDTVAPKARPELQELANQIEAVPVEDLPALAEMVCRAGHEDHERLLEEVELRHRLDAHMGRGRASFLTLAGTAVLVATVLRVAWFGDRPFLGFGLLGGLLLLGGLRGWYRASEARQRLLLADASAETEEIVAAIADAPPARPAGRRRRAR